MCLLSVDDLFTAGIGFDVVGAFLLARGLLVSAKQSLRRAYIGFGGLGFGQLTTRAEDWVDGWFGASSLMLGFILQLIAYTLVIGRAKVQTGVGPAGVAAGFAAVAIALVPVVWFSVRSRLLRLRCVSLSRGLSSDGRPDAYMLTGIARELGREARSVQEVPDILRELFGVTDYATCGDLEALIEGWREPSRTRLPAPGT
jgi:hypothetical protein